MNKEYNRPVDVILDNIHSANNGFSEAEIAIAEKENGVKLPEFLRQYYSKYGKHKINYTHNRLFTPDEIRTLYKCFEAEYADDPEDFVDTYEINLDEMKEATADYLIFYCENQGVWQAGPSVDELSEHDPKMYYDGNGINNWAFMSNSASSFLLSMLWENLKWSGFDFEHYLNDTAKITEVALSNSIDLDKLMSSQLNNKYCRTCFDNDAKKFYFFLINKNGALVELIIANYSLFN